MIREQFEKYCLKKRVDKAKDMDIKSPLVICFNETVCRECKWKWINKHTLPTDKVYAVVDEIEGKYSDEFTECLEELRNKLKQLESKGG